MIRFRLPVALNVALAAAYLTICQPVDAVLAGVCGDDVDGRRIACSCGDIVVSDTTLQEDDPVVRQPCAIDGLTLRARTSADTIVLDLGGHAIIGRGTGIGIQVDHGGADGARIVGGGPETRGILAGFASGIVSRREGELARIERVIVRSSRRDGISVRLAGAVIAHVESSGNGGDGIRVTGYGGRLIDVVAEHNGEVGIRVLSTGSHVSGRASHNVGDGILVHGRRNVLEGIETDSNGGRGIAVRGDQTELIDIKSYDNENLMARRAGETTRGFTPLPRPHPEVVNNSQQTLPDSQEASQ